MSVAEQTRYLFECWSTHHGIAHAQISSYDHFVTTKLQEIIAEGSSLKVENERRGVTHTIEFGKVSIRSPAIREADGAYHALTPQECRIRALSYNVGVYVDVTHCISGPGESSQRIYVETLLCKVPCMVRSVACTLSSCPVTGPTSRECPLDPGAYFIVNGNEKAVVGQEKLRTNFVFVKRTGPRSCAAEIRSLHAAKTRSTSTLNVTLGQKTSQRGELLNVILPFVDAAVPLAVIFKLLGFAKVSDTVNFILDQIPPIAETRRGEVRDLLVRALDTPMSEEPVSALVDWIGKEGTKEPTAQRRARYVEHILANEFLPHMGLDPGDEAKNRKAAFLAHAVMKLSLVFLGALPEDDRDDYSLKRVEVTGALFSLLFRQLFRNFLKMLSLHLNRAVEAGKYVNIVDALCPKKITAGFKYALNTGNWGVQKSASQNGVAQVMTRMNFLANVSHLRRISTPINRDGKLPKPRELSTSHYGVLCPVETPEGQACGLVENFSFFCHVRIGAPAFYVVRQLFRDELVVPLSCVKGLPRGITSMWKVLVNGALEGYCADGTGLADELRTRRRTGILPFDITIATLNNTRSVIVDTDPGCLLRPLMRTDCLDLISKIVAGTPPPLLWSELLSRGVVDLVDKNEERNLLVVAFGVSTLGATHLEFHPSSMLGICAGAIPFLNHNQAPRNIYESAMAKQSIGVSSLASDHRVDAVAHVLHYPQVPLVSTLMHEALGYSQTPCSCNVVVAILSYTGFNQEDSVIFNRAALDRGLFRSTVLKSYKDEEKGVGSDLERFGRVPTTAIGSRRANYDKVEADGLPPLRAKVGNSDVIIAKRMTTSALGSDRKKKKEPVTVDHSTVLAASEAMRVNRAYLTTNKDGARLVRVRLHAVRIPDLGDKFASVHGQKGVIGMVLDECDMPFCTDGSIPDLIINPHAIPSRMTVAQLIESLLGKVCCLEGEDGDGTPFNSTRVEDISDRLAKRGFESRGNETLYNGITGVPFETTIFVGPTSYQKLRHCVTDKVHARSRGPRQLITRQPVEGRSRGGGLRIGEMERDCMLAHGASSVLLDRMFLQSDQFDIWICRSCGLIAESLAPSVPLTVGTHREYCRNCRLGGEANIAKVQLPYSAKLLCQELGQLNIAVRMRVEALENVKE
jgi:DNA-directed RNA polymerase II subunit RPB2